MNRYVTSGRVKSRAEAELVVQLTTMYYDEDEAVYAAVRVGDVTEAERMLRLDCELCANTIKRKEVSK